MFPAASTTPGAVNKSGGRGYPICVTLLAALRRFTPARVGRGVFWSVA